MRDEAEIRSELEAMEELADRTDGRIGGLWAERAETLAWVLEEGDDAE